MRVLWITGGICQSAGPEFDSARGPLIFSTPNKWVTVLYHLSSSFRSSEAAKFHPSRYRKELAEPRQNNMFSTTNSESGTTAALKRTTHIISLTYNSSSWVWQLVRTSRLILSPCFDFCSHRVTGWLELRRTRGKHHQHQTTKLFGTTAITSRYWSAENVLRTQKYRISGTAFSN